jgi:hypothetical protein
VVTTKCPAARGGSGAILVPRGDFAAVVRQLLRLCDHAEERDQLAAAGLDAAAPMTWERTAEGIENAVAGMTA